MYIRALVIGYISGVVVTTCSIIYVKKLNELISIGRDIKKLKLARRTIADIKIEE